MLRHEAARLRTLVCCLLGSVVFGPSCSQFKTLSRADALSPDEKLEYLVLATLDTETARQYTETATERGRGQLLEWFWSRRADSVPGREELLRRARAAREFFGGSDLFGDERVPTYIRLGPPRLEHYEPPPVENDTARIVTNPAETWSYDSLGRQFDFVKTGAAYHLVGEIRFGRGWFPPAFEPVDMGRPAPPVLSDARALDLDIAVGRLRQHGDTVQVEIHYGIATSDSAVIPSGRQNLLHLDINMTGRRGAVTRLAVWLGCSWEPTARMVVGRGLFELPADVYQVTVTMTTADGSATATKALELDLVDYTRKQQPTSDILFCSLVDSVFQSPQFTRPDWSRAVPLVRPEVVSGDAFYVLYEVYNLTTDSAGFHRAEATYELIEEESGLLAVIPSPSRFVTGSGSTGVATERVHTMDLRPGRYLLVSRLRDLNGGGTSSVTAAFDILPRRQ